LAEEFAASLNSPVMILSVRLPDVGDHPAQWNLDGATLEMEADVHDKVKTIKERVSEALGGCILANKIQLRTSDGTFLKNSQSLAALNIAPKESMMLVPKSRARRK